jgi:hypothetical protein
MSESLDSERVFLRHAVATVAYRGAKALRGAPSDFEHFRVSSTSRTPVEILAHIGDLFDWAIHLAGGQHIWKDSNPSPWRQEVQRFFDALSRLDSVLASESRLGCPVEKLFQGPIADALSHVGQIAFLRRLARSPVRGENYFKAEIVVGRLSDEQARPIREFE